MTPTPMPASDRLRRALALLEPLDLPRGTKAPPLHRLLWRAGIEVPPPLLASWRFNAVLMGSLFGPLFAALSATLTSLRPGASQSVLQIVVIATVAGAVFGALTATSFRSEARRHRLPAWDSLA